MRHLLRLISLRYLRATPGRTLLTLFGITLGVAAVFAIDIVNGSVKGSFRSTIDSIAGKTALMVRAGSGVEETLLEVVRAVPGVKAAVPIVEQTARERKTGTQMMVMGVDTLVDSNVRDYELSKDDVQVDDEVAFLNDPNAVIITHEFAKRAGLKVGDTLLVETVQGAQELKVRGTLTPRGPAKVFGGNLLLMDVYAAQIAFGLGKRFDHIDIVPEADQDVESLRIAIDKALEGKAEVVRPERRSAETERLMAGFQLGLTLASLVAMFVGGFNVYNALAIAVAQRRREIGILRALGATRREILLLFIGEGLVLGGVGALAGLGLGFLMARMVLGVVGEAVSALYVPVQPDQLTISPRDLIVAVSLGVAASFVAAFFPARRAAFIEPASAMRKKLDAGDVNVSSTAASLKASGAAVVLSVIVAVLAHVYESYVIGYGVAVTLAFAAAFVTPAFARGVGWLARRLAPRLGPATLLGCVSFIRNAGRNSVAIAALGMGLANVVNADAFVTSMKASTSSWFERTVRADVFVFAGRGKASMKVDHPLPASVRDELAAAPGVEFVDAYRSRRHTFRGEPFYLTSNDLERSRNYNDLPVIAGDLDRAIAGMKAGTGLAASESFTTTFKVKLGDKITLPTPDGPREFELLMIYVDYAADLGILLTTRDTYERIWRDSLVDTFEVYLHEGHAPEQVRAHVASTIGTRYKVLALSNGEFRRDYMGLIDDTFAVTRATEIVAILVAILGIINTMLVSVLDRRTELGVLKAIGSDRRQIQQMMLTEGALIGLSATALGTLWGLAFSAYVVKELLFFQIGWSLDWHLSGLVLLETFVIAQLVTLLATWLPMRAANRIDAVEALQYD
jgi:putative ABC transport system permease protein